MFWCPHADCAARYSVAGQWNIVAQFQDQIKAAIRSVKVRYKYGGWVKEWEAEELCVDWLLLWDHDGTIDGWYLDAKGNPDTVRAYCYRELWGDLMHLYEKRVRQARRGL